METMNKPTTLAELMRDLQLRSNQHEPGTQLHNAWRVSARAEVAKRWSGESEEAQDFPPFGKLTFPYQKMGAIDSLNLFDIEELILFSFYWYNRKRYRRAADVGANIGLHSIVMSMCGYEVRAFEPDPEHVHRLALNLKLNKCSNVDVRQAAVSGSAGEAEFIRVLGNTTGSHIAGAKTSPYGELDRIKVRLDSVADVMQWADLVKFDVEGHELAVLKGTNKEMWAETDAVVEIGSKDNAHGVYEYLQNIGVNMYAQKINWGRVTNLKQMPTSYRDGSLYISDKSTMPWPELVRVT